MCSNASLQPEPTSTHSTDTVRPALMLAAINGRTEVVRILVDTGADLGLRGTGAPGFAGKTALDLAIGKAIRRSWTCCVRGAPTGPNDSQ